MHVYSYIIHHYSLQILFKSVEIYMYFLPHETQRVAVFARTQFIYYISVD